MLEKLDTIDWANMEDGGNWAKEVPGYLRDLLSEDEEVRSEAMEMLYGTIVHQGTVFSFTAPAVPFLIELLESGRLSDSLEGDILGLLAAAADGAPLYSDGEGQNEKMVQAWREGIERSGRNWREVVDRAALYVRQAHDAVGEGVEVYLRLLRHGQPQVRDGAMVLLARFREHASQTVAPVKEAIRSETDIEVKAHLLYELSNLVDDGPDTLAYFRDFMREGQDAVIRFAAAYAITNVAGRNTQPEVVDALVALLPAVRNDTLARRDNPAEQGRPFYLYRSLSTVVDALEKVGPKVGVAALASLLPVAEEMAWHGADEVVKGMLSLAFGRQIVEQSARPGRIIKYRLASEGSSEPHGKAPRPEELTPWQREALEALVNSDDAWLSQSNLLELLDLPTSRVGVKAFLQASTRS